jgi:hypothetical protein
MKVSSQEITLDSNDAAFVSILDLSAVFCADAITENNDMLVKRMIFHELKGGFGWIMSIYFTEIQFEGLSIDFDLNKYNKILKFSVA